MKRLLFVLLLLVASPAAAQDWPSKPIRFVVPFATGGATDVLTRLLCEQLTAELKVPCVVDNKGGAGGIIGTEMTAQAPGDGYTLLLHSASITYDPSLHQKLPYDTMKDLVPVAMIGTTPNILVVNPSFPARSAADLIRTAQQKPGSITFATGGYGSSSHLAVALFSYLSNTKFNHVPYKGAGPALADVVAGHIDFTVATMPGAIGQVRAKTLRALGVSSLVRAPELPEVPTIADSGLPGYHYVAWFGVFAPGTTPPALVAQLNNLLQQALRAPDTREKLGAQGVEPQLLSAEQFRDMVKSEIVRWHGVIEKSGITATP